MKPTGFTNRFDDCAAKLAILDDVVGQRTSDQVLEPFALGETTAPNVDSAARRIADFVGLGGFTFLTSFSSQEDHVAGNIELRDNVVIRAGGIQLRAAFGDVCSIKLSKTIRSVPNAVLATLAHEITHKYLQVNRVPSTSGPRGFEDEILTDIASIWLGLGKLVLNGCESHLVETNWSGTTTSRHTVGYMTRTQFAYTYLLVSTRRELSELEYKRGLGDDALTALRDAHQYLRDESHG
jgi:hypothetical protein